MKQNILVVDDNPHIINKIIDVLSENNANYNFFPAKNGRIGYELATYRMPDLIITDWDMPIVNGIELIRELKKNKLTKEIPIIMATAVMLTSENLKEALDAGAMDYIRKPIDPVELVARTQSVLRVSEYYKQLVEVKNKELAENTLFLIKNNKFNSKIIEQLQNLKPKIVDKDNKISTLFNNIITRINSKIKDDSWQRFELSFNSVNNEFTKNLVEKFSKLSASELKLSIFLKLGLSTKDIATVLYQSPNSIKVSRFRLRKKLELSNEQNLQTFLSVF